MKGAIERIKLNQEELEAVLERVKKTVEEEDYKTLKMVVDTLAFVTRLLEKTGITVRRLRRLIFGSWSEKTRDVLTPSEEAGAGAQEEAAGEESASPSEDEGEKEKPKKKKRKGHGRNGADAYTGGAKIEVPHESLKSRDPCPELGCKGKVYELAKPGVLVRITGQAPVGATIYGPQKLRCNLCGTVFTARVPEGVSREKYDEKAASMIALLHYGSGLPFNRLEGLEGALGIPLPATTQWEIMERLARFLKPTYDELIRQAAQGDVVYNDDTTMKVLELMKENRDGRTKEKDAGREGFG